MAKMKWGAAIWGDGTQASSPHGHGIPQAGSPQAAPPEMAVFPKSRHTLRTIGLQLLEFLKSRAAILLRAGLHAGAGASERGGCGLAFVRRFAACVVLQVQCGFEVLQFCGIDPRRPALPEP
jgi:hypothetical protein